MYNIMNEYHKQNDEWKQPDAKEYISYDSIYIGFKNRQTNLW